MLNSLGAGEEEEDENRDPPPGDRRAKGFFPLGQAFANPPASNGAVKKHQIYGAFLREKCNISSYVCGIESEFSHSALLLAKFWERTCIKHMYNLVI